MKTESGLRFENLTLLFGGRFDPPHLGHQDLLTEMIEEPRMERIAVLPSPAPRHKSTLVSIEHRWNMAQLMVDQVKQPNRVALDSLELERWRKDPSVPSTTFPTLVEFVKQGHRAAVIIGSDQFLSLSQWYRFPEILSLAHWIVAVRATGPGLADQRPARFEIQRMLDSGLLTYESPRASHPLRRQLICLRTKFDTELRLVETHARALSSSEIRTEIAKTGRISPDSVLPSVEAYLKANRLYGTQS